MLWVEAFHVIFVVAWYAGLLYLPRLFVYHAQTDDATGDERFRVMERKLFMIMTVGGIGALVFGLWLVADYAWAAFAASGWFRAKLVLAGALVLYHLWCGKLVADFAAGRKPARASLLPPDQRSAGVDPGRGGDPRGGQAGDWGGAMARTVQCVVLKREAESLDNPPHPGPLGGPGGLSRTCPGKAGPSGSSACR